MSKEEDAEVGIEDLGTFLKMVARGLPKKIKIKQEDWKPVLEEIGIVLRRIFHDPETLDSQASFFVVNMMDNKLLERNQKWSDERDCSILGNVDARLYGVRLLWCLGLFSPELCGDLLIDPAKEIEKGTVFGRYFIKCEITALPVATKASAVTFAPDVGTPVQGIVDSQGDVSPLTLETGLAMVCEHDFTLLSSPPFDLAS